jgi:hypothetical protein
MFIEQQTLILFNPEGIICYFSRFLHKIPSGLRTNALTIFYKHTFPSGIWEISNLRHEADNSVFYQTFPKTVNFWKGLSN